MGNELADGLGEAGWLALGLGAGVLGGAVLGVLLGVTLGVLLAETVGVPPPAANEGGAVDGEPDEHADTDAAVSMANAAQRSTDPRRRGRP